MPDWSEAHIFKYMHNNFTEKGMIIVLRIMRERWWNQRPFFFKTLYHWTANFECLHFPSVNDFLDFILFFCFYLGDPLVYLMCI